MKKSIWSPGRNVTVSKVPDARPWPIFDAVEYPLYLCDDERLVLDQKGKSVYNITQCRLCGWVCSLISDEDQIKLTQDCQITVTHVMINE